MNFLELHFLRGLSFYFSFYFCLFTFSVLCMLFPWKETLNYHFLNF